MSERILVTGAAGFSGTHLCQYLTRGHAKIYGTFHEGSARARHSFCEWLPLDLTSPASVERTIMKLVPTQVYHLAAQSSARKSWKQVDATLAVNSAGTIRLLEALRRYAPKTSLLVVSSAQVSAGYFRKSDSDDPDHRIYPFSPYGMSKALCELAALNYAQSFGIKALVARSFNHIGLGQSPEYVLADWCKQVAEIEAGSRPGILSVGNVDVCRDFLSVADVVRAYRTIMKKGSVGTLYDVASGHAKSLRHYLELLQSLSEVKITVKQAPGKVRRSEVRVIEGNVSNIKTLGWKPQGSVEKTLEDMLNEWRRKVKS